MEALLIKCQMGEKQQNTERQDSVFLTPQQALARASNVERQASVSSLFGVRFDNWLWLLV